MAKILNLTQHNATTEQSEDGVFEPSAEDKKKIQTLITFDAIPTIEEMENRADEIAFICLDYDVRAVMIGGAPFFSSVMESVLKRNGFKPLYAFSVRESIEVQTPNGVEKKSIFKHVGFVEV